MWPITHSVMDCHSLTLGPKQCADEINSSIQTWKVEQLFEKENVFITTWH